MKRHPNHVAIERLKDAYAIIDGIPPERIHLDMFQQFNNDNQYAHDVTEIKCGTICCAGGWLALHPKVRKWGITADDTGCPVLARNPDEFANSYKDSYKVLATVFKIDYYDAEALFRPRRWALDGSLRSEKQLWLDRCLDLIGRLERGQA
jgi:hypothetical protein